MKPCYDVLSIQDLTVKTTIGVYDWEQQVKQTLKIDLDFATNCKTAAAQDDITQTHDYAAICSEMTAFIEQSCVQLLETLAENTAQFLLETYRLTWLRLTIAKFGVIKNANCVRICIERSE